MMVWVRWPALMLALVLFVGCDEPQHKVTADQKDQSRQEQLTQEGQARYGLPNLKNFREKGLAKEIMELRDQTGLVTYTYAFAEQTGHFTFVGESVGYGLPYSVQYTNPSKVEYFRLCEGNGTWGSYVLPQCDPNGLFSPPGAEGTWVMLKDPESSAVKPFYSETRLTVVPFKLPAQIVYDPTGRHGPLAVGMPKGVAAEQR